MTQREAIASAARKAAPLFKHHGWTWATITRNGGVPTEADIAEAFEDKVRNMLKDPAINRIRGGRLAVRREVQEPGFPDLIVLSIDLEEFEVGG